VFVFTNTADDSLASLAKQLDKLVATNSAKQLAAVVHFTGDPTDEFSKKIQAFGKKHKLKNVTLAITADQDRFDVNDDAKVTVMAIDARHVAYNFATDGELKEEDIESILKGSKKVVN